MAYGSRAGTVPLVQHLLGSGTDFSASTKPTSTQVDAFLVDGSAILDGWLAEAGYTIPVTDAEAVLILDHYAELFAAYKCELSRATGAYGAEGNDRGETFKRDFMEAQDLIKKSDALVNLGAARTKQEGKGFKVGGLSPTDKTDFEADTDRTQPIFKKGMFENV